MQDWKDRDLKTLFREMRECDLEAATRFHGDWELARSRMAAAHKTPPKYAFIMASIAVAAVIVAVAVRLVSRPSAIRQQSARSQELGAPVHDQVDRRTAATATESQAVRKPAEPLVARPFVTRRVAAVKRSLAHGSARYQEPDTRARQDQQQISTWRSPTDFLLKSAGDDLLRRVPNMQDSVVMIDGR